MATRVVGERSAVRRNSQTCGSDFVVDHAAFLILLRSTITPFSKRAPARTRGNEVPVDGNAVCFPGA
jgi:hypothetical protein